MYRHNVAQESRWLTTADAKRVLRMTAEGVRWQVHQGRLAAEQTRSGQYLFRFDDVERLAHQRATTALVTVRPRLRLVTSQPRQLALFGAQVVRGPDGTFAPRGALGDRQAKGRAIVPGSRR